MYWPCASVVAVRTRSISAGLLASTVTPGITAPVVSFTTPAIPVACANTAAGNSTAHDQANTNPETILRITPPGCRLSDDPETWQTSRMMAAGALTDIKTVLRRDAKYAPAVRASSGATIYFGPVASVSKTMKWLIWLGVLMIAGLLPAGALAQRPSAAAGRSAGDLRARRRADSLQPVRVVPSARRPRAVQPPDLRRRAAAGDADCRGHQQPLHAAVETGSRDSAIWPANAASPTSRSSRSIAGSQRGLLEGNPADVPPPPRWSGGWQLGEPDLVVTLPEYTLPADGADVFRNFVVAVPGATARYVRGLEFRPGSRAVHHANIRVDPTPASRRLDGADPAPGYEGTILRSADYPDGHFLGWTPGQATPLASSDLAWRLDAGSDLVVQLHLQPTGKPEPLRPSIGLYFTAEAPTRTPTIVRLGRQDLDIPAGAAAHHIVDAYVLPVDAEIRAIQPHAHYRARRSAAWATLPGGGRRPLILIRNWDFNWQDQYRYATPFWVPAGTKLEMEYVFDNSDANSAQSRATRPGASGGDGDRRTRWPTSGFR